MRDFYVTGLASSVGLGRLCMSLGRRTRPFTSRLNANLTTQLPLTILNSPRVSDPASGGGRLDFGTAGDIIGIILFVIGFALEATADQTKWMFKQSKPPKGAIIQKGPWCAFFQVFLRMPRVCVVLNSLPRSPHLLQEILPPPKLHWRDHPLVGHLRALCISSDARCHRFRRSPGSHSLRRRTPLHYA